MGTGVAGELAQRTADRLIAHRRTASRISGPMLAHHVRHLDIRAHGHHLHSAEAEVIDGTDLVPLPVGGFWLGPAAGQGHDEARAPRARIIADMSNDLQPGALRRGGITLDIANLPDISHLRCPLSQRPYPRASQWSVISAGHVQNGRLRLATGSADD